MCVCVCVRERKVDMYNREYMQDDFKIMLANHVPLQMMEHQGSV